MKSAPTMLAIFAHPDDESIRAGGTLAIAHLYNIRTIVVCATLGELGIFDRIYNDKKKLTRIRSKELDKACSIFGISRTIHGHFADGTLANNLDLPEWVDDILQQIHPKIIITHDPTGATGHPDHIALSQAVTQAHYFKKHPRSTLYYAVLSETERDMYNSSRPFIKRFMLNATHYMDIRSVAHIKALACEAHKSQKLSGSKPVPLSVWYKIFDKEYFYLVDSPNIQRFRYFPFHTKHFHFIP